jgi:putative transposase
MKKKVATCLSRDERVALVDRTGGELLLSAQTQLLGLNRTSLYYQPVPPSAEEIALKHRIDQLSTDHPYYGSRRIDFPIVTGRAQGQSESRDAAYA